MSMRSFDIKVFEYIHHLYSEKKDESHLSWADHVSCDPSIWKPDAWLLQYEKLAFENCSDLIKGKRVLDMGCNIGSKISWLENYGATHYTGVDPNAHDLKYAKIVADIVDINCELVNTTAENFEYKNYDTGLLLSVTHWLRDQELVLSKLFNHCQHTIIDTWIAKEGCNGLSYYLDLAEEHGHKIISVDNIGEQKSPWEKQLIVTYKDGGN